MHPDNKITLKLESGGSFIDKMVPYQSIACLYDDLLGNSMFALLQRNFDWLIREYNIKFHSVADVACGTGSFVSYLARRKTQVFGVDRSSAMLRIARLNNRGNGADFLCQDMRRLELPHNVDLITCNFDSLNYLLTMSDLMKAFNSFNANLSEGGNLIFDMITDSCKKKPPACYTRRFDAPGIISLWFISWDPLSRLRTVVVKNFIKRFDHSYGCEHEIHRERSYPIAIISNLLSNCRFVIRGVHDAYSILPASKFTTRAVFVAQKPVAQIKPL